MNKKIVIGGGLIVTMVAVLAGCAAMAPAPAAKTPTDAEIVALTVNL